MVPRTGEARASPPKTNRRDCRHRLGRTSGLRLLATWAVLSSCLSCVSLAAPSYSSQLAFRRTMGSEGSIRRKVNSHRFSLDNHASHRSVLLSFAPPPHMLVPLPARQTLGDPSLFCNLGVGAVHPFCFLHLGWGRSQSRTPARLVHMRSLCAPRRVLCALAAGKLRARCPFENLPRFKRELAPLCLEIPLKHLTLSSRIAPPGPRSPRMDLLWRPADTRRLTKRRTSKRAMAGICAWKAVTQPCDF